MDQKQFIIGTLLAILFIWLLFSAPFLNSQPEPSKGEDGKQASNTLVIGRNAIYVPDHTPGSAIFISFALFSRNGFAVIHEDANGNPGKIIGATALLESGENNGIIAQLSRSSRAGEVLYAMLHEDNGDGWFDPADDPPIKDDSGNIVLMKFSVTESTNAAGTVNP